MQDVSPQQSEITADDLVRVVGSLPLDVRGEHHAFCIETIGSDRVISWSGTGDRQTTMFPDMFTQWLLGLMVDYAGRRGCYYVDTPLGQLEAWASLCREIVRREGGE